MTTQRIHLASQSPRRAQLLGQMGIPFDVVSVGVDEQVTGTPAEQVRLLAQRKAQAAAQTLADGWVLAADTLVFLNGQPLGKPQSASDAHRMLSALSGRTHEVLTGMCLLNAGTGSLFVRHDGAQVVFDTMTQDDISSYIATGEPMDKAGAYGIQGAGGMYIKCISGDYYAVVGLSLAGLRTLLVQAGLW